MKILIVEPETSGHHPFYLRLILRAFTGHACWLLTAPAAPEYTELVATAPDPAAAALAGRVEVEDGRPGAAVAAAVELAERERFDLVFMPFIDLMLRHLTRGAAARLGRVGGIWMGPNALDRRYRFAPPLAKRPRTHGRIHRWLRRPETAASLRDLLFLAPDDVDQLARVAPGIRGHLLHDPPEAASPLGQAAARQALGLPADGCILLHPGSAGRRKGLGFLLDAYRRLESAGGRGPFLYRVGPIDLAPMHRRQLDAMEQRGGAATTGGYVPTAELAAAFAACDWVAMPYRKFRHSSGIQANAQAAARPVLAADYGLIADRIRGEPLDDDRGGGPAGRLYRHGSVRALAAALGRLEALPAPVPTSRPQWVAAQQDNFVASLSGWLARVESESAA